MTSNWVVCVDWCIDELVSAQFAYVDWKTVGSFAALMTTVVYFAVIKDAHYGKDCNNVSMTRTSKYRSFIHYGLTHYQPKVK